MPPGVIQEDARDAEIARFSKLAGRNNWCEKYSSNALRVTHREILVPMIEDIIKEKTTQEWISLLEENNIPCGPVNTIEQAFHDPQVVHRKMSREMTRPDGTTIPVVANPINFSKTPVEYKFAPPKLEQ